MRIQRIREWQEGFEELEPVTNSFALEIKGEHDARCMYTDNAEDKVRENKGICHRSPTLTVRDIGKPARAFEQQAFHAMNATPDAR